MKIIKHIITTILVMATIVTSTYANNREVGTIETISGICNENIELDNSGNKLYGADFKINNLYFDFGDEKFEKACLNNKVQIVVKWIGEYNFIIQSKEVLPYDTPDMHTDEKDNFDELIIDNNENTDSKYNKDLNVSEEAKFDTFLSVNKMSYSEKKKYIQNNKDAVYQELYEILNILNEDVQYYEVDENNSYSERDIFTDKTRMIELYK